MVAMEKEDRGKRKNSMDMLQGPLIGKIIFFALPLAISAVLQQLFNAADVAVVGRFASPDAMAAVGSNAPVIGLLESAGFRLLFPRSRFPCSLGSGGEVYASQGRKGGE